MCTYILNRYLGFASRIISRSETETEGESLGQMVRNKQINKEKHKISPDIEQANILKCSS